MLKRDSDPLDTETGEVINQAEEDANAPPPETIIVKMRGRPAGSKNKAKAENPTIEKAQPDPMYKALMKRLDDMDGMLAQRQEREGTTKTQEGKSGKGYITGASFEGGI